MSGFHEVRFPDSIAYGAMGGPEFARCFTTVDRYNPCDALACRI